MNIYVLTRKKKKIFEKSGQEVDYSVTRGTESWVSSKSPFFWKLILYSALQVQRGKENVVNRNDACVVYDKYRWESIVPWSACSDGVDPESILPSIGS